MATRRWSRGSTFCKESMFAPSLFASLGLGWVSINKPSAPTAIAVRAKVSIFSGLPPVTPEE